MRLTMVVGHGRHLEHRLRIDRLVTSQEAVEGVRVDGGVLNALGVRDCHHHLSLYTNTNEEFIVVQADERLIDTVPKL